MNQFRCQFEIVTKTGSESLNASVTAPPLIDVCHTTRFPASLPEHTFGAFGAGEGVPPFNPLLNNGADALCLPTM